MFLKRFPLLLSLIAGASIVFTSGYSSLAQGIEAREIDIPYEELSLAGLGTVTAFDWSPDGRAFAIATGNNLRTYRSNLSEIAYWEAHTDLITSLDWSPDGERIVTSSLDGMVRVWNAVIASPTYGHSLYVLERNTPVFQAIWSPVAADQRLATVELVRLEQTSESARTITEVKIWDGETHSFDVTLPGSPTERDVGHLAWSSDGRYLAYSGFQFSRDYVISIWDAATGQGLSDYEADMSRVNGISWHPSGSAIAYADDLNRVTVAGVLPEGGVAYQAGFAAAPGGHAFAVAWNPAGTELALGGSDGHIYLWNPVRNEAQVFSISHEDDVIQVAWLPDGERLMSLSREGIVRIWNLSGLIS